jgi:hypothetical protein
MWCAFNAVLTAVKLLMLVLWIVTTCGLANKYQRRNIPPPQSVLEVILSSKTLVSA